MNDWNRKIIEEFRANQGKVGGQFEGAPMVILHTTGRKSGKEYENPLVYQPLDGAYAVFASKGGAPEHPDWYRNLMEAGRAEVEVGTQRLEVTAREAQGEERERIWSKQKQVMPGFADYEKATDRTIPVVVLEPA